MYGYLTWDPVLQSVLMEWDICLHFIAFSFPLIFAATYKKDYKNANAFLD